MNKWTAVLLKSVGEENHPGLGTIDTLQRVEFYVAKENKSYVYVDFKDKDLHEIYEVDWLVASQFWTILIRNGFEKGQIRKTDIENEFDPWGEEEKWLNERCVNIANLENLINITGIGQNETVQAA